MNTTGDVSKVEQSQEKTVDTTKQNQKRPPSTNVMKLTEVDLIKMKNLGLQRENLEIQRANIDLQQALLIKDLSIRAGVNLNGWMFDPVNGVLVKPQPRPVPSETNGTTTPTQTEDKVE